MSDLKFAFRQLLKNPGFTAVAVLTLALGIGANTAIFSIINGVLLKPLPYPEPERLVTLWERSPQRGIEQERVSGPDYLDWRAQNTVLADLSVSPGWEGSETFNLLLADGTAKVHAGYNSASLFTTLGTKPLLGRTLLPEEDQKEGNRAVVLSYGLWQRHFGGDSNVIGRTLTVDTYGRRDYTIVGVMPPGFGLPSRCELWLPLGWMGVTLDSRRSAHWHNVIARLKPGVTLAQAQTELSAIQARLARAYPGETIGSEVAIVPLLHQALGRNLHTALLVLWGVVAGVLLIACANVANLMLARAATRQKEITIRLAMGAGRWRVMRQLLIESVVLAVLGGGVGVLLGWWGIQAFVAIGPGNIPRLGEVTLDGMALAFTLGLSLEEQPRAEFKGITPDWVRALGGRRLRGRDFTEADTLLAPGAVLINETLARRYFPTEDPIGQRLRMGNSQPALGTTNVWGLSEWSEIIGVISDIKSLHPQPEAIPEVYQSYWQWPMQNPTLLIRTTGDPAPLAEAIRRETRALIPNLPPPLIRTMDDLLAETVAQSRLQTGLLSLFAAVALLLAAVGLYGVLAYLVTQRQREIGVRLALGAQNRDVLWLVIGQGMKLALAGVAIGIVGALALTRTIRSLLYGVRPTDPATFTAVSLMLIAVTLLACWLPARRATRIDPMEALRTE